MRFAFNVENFVFLYLGYDLERSWLLGALQISFRFEAFKV